MKALTWSTLIPTANTRSKASSVPRVVFLWVSYGLIALNVGLLVSYFVGVNNYTSHGYEIRKLQSSISQLTQDNKKLSLKVSELSSIAMLQTEIAGSRFVPVESTIFLQVNRYTKR